MASQAIPLSLGDFAQPSAELSESLIQQAAKFHELAMQLCAAAGICPVTFPQLITEGMDIEQIWAQIDVDQRAFLDAVAPEGDVDLDEPSSQAQQSMTDDAEDIDEYTENLTAEDEEGAEELASEAEPSNADDEAGSQEQGYSEEIDEDEYDQIEEDEDEQPSEGAGADEIVDFSESSEETGLGETAHTRRMEELRRQAEELEEELVAEKPWQLRGEVGAADREGTLLDADGLVFDVGARVAPELTPEWTAQIERMLLRRIEDDAFDDPVRVDRPSEEQGPTMEAAAEELGKQSSKSLAEIYEAQYLDAQAVARGQLTAAQKQLELRRAEAREMFTRVMFQLDSLSNYHFTPMPSAGAAHEGGDTIQVLRAAGTGVAAANMEDAPSAVAPEQAAPREVMAQVRGRDAVSSAQERTSAERQALHRAKRRTAHRTNAERAEERRQRLRLAQSGTASAPDMRLLQHEARRAIDQGLDGVERAKETDKTNWFRASGRGIDAARSN